MSRDTEIAWYKKELREVEKQILESDNKRLAAEERLRESDEQLKACLDRITTLETELERMGILVKEQSAKLMGES